MGRMKDIAIEQMNEEQQNNDYALSLNNQLRAMEEDRNKLYEKLIEIFNITKDEVVYGRVRPCLTIEEDWERLHKEKEELKKKLINIHYITKQ